MVRFVELAEVGDTPNQKRHFRESTDTDYVGMRVVGEGISGDDVNSPAGLFLRASTCCWNRLPGNLLGGFDGEIKPDSRSRNTAEISNERPVINFIRPRGVDGGFHGEPRTLSGHQCLARNARCEILRCRLPCHLLQCVLKLPLALLQTGGGNIHALRGADGGTLHSLRLPLNLSQRITSNSSVYGGSNESEPCSDREPYLYAIVLTVISAAISFACFACVLFGPKLDKMIPVAFLVQLLCFLGIAYGTYKFLDIRSRCDQGGKTNTNVIYTVLYRAQGFSQ